MRVICEGEHHQLHWLRVLAVQTEASTVSTRRRLFGGCDGVPFAVEVLSTHNAHVWEPPSCLPLSEWRESPVEEDSLCGVSAQILERDVSMSRSGNGQQTRSEVKRSPDQSLPDQQPTGLPRRRAEHLMQRHWGLNPAFPVQRRAKRTSLTGQVKT